MFNQLRQRLAEALEKRSAPPRTTEPESAPDSSQPTHESTSDAIQPPAAPITQPQPTLPTTPAITIAPLDTYDPGADDADGSIFNLCYACLDQNPSLGHLDYYGPAGNPVHLRAVEVPSGRTDRIQMGARLAAYWYVDTFQLVGDLVQSDLRISVHLAELVSFILDADPLLSQQIAATIQPMPFYEESFTSPESRLAALRAEIIQSLVIVGGENAPNNLAADLKTMIIRGGYPRRPELVIQLVQYLCWIDELSETVVLCECTGGEEGCQYIADDDED